MLFTAAQILNFIFKSFDVLHVEIFYAAERKSYLKNQKKNILWRMKILFYVQNFIIIIIFFSDMSEWVSRKNAPAGNDSENTQKKKIFPFCVQIKMKKIILYRTWKMQNNNKWIAPASWKWNLDQRICAANKKIHRRRRKEKQKSAGRKYKNKLKRD